MYKYVKCYKMGYIDGTEKAKEDKKKHKTKKFIEVDDYVIMSKLYDIGYINGYNNYLKISLK